MRRFYIDKFVAPRAGCRIIDIGCGPGDIIEFLPAVEYTGIDYNPRYIEAAAARFGQRAKFMVGRVGDDLGTLLTPADLVMANALIHHLDDAETLELLTAARRLLKPDGRFVSLDNLIYKGQSKISRFLIKNDRGVHPRTEENYVALAKKVFSHVRVEHRKDLLRVPYDIIMMECRP